MELLELRTLLQREPHALHGATRAPRLGRVTLFNVTEPNGGSADQGPGPSGIAEAERIREFDPYYVDLRSRGLYFLLGWPEDMVREMRAFERGAEQAWLTQRPRAAAYRRWRP